MLVWRATRRVPTRVLTALLPGCGVRVCGHWQIDDACKKFRVYANKAVLGDDPNDYLIDHSVMFYLVDPSGPAISSSPPLPPRISICLILHDVLVMMEMHASQLRPPSCGLDGVAWV